MSRRAAASVLALGILVALAASARGGPDRPARGPKTWTWSFAADTLGRPPANTQVFGGRWEIALEEGPAAGDTAAVPAGSGSGANPGSVDSAAAASPDRPRLLRQMEADDGEPFHYIQFRRPVVGDLIASVRFRILSGELDPAAGLLFQLDRKGRSGYLLRVSGRSNRLIAHYLLYGKRRDLKHVQIDPIRSGEWHTLEVRRKGSILVARYDGRDRFMVRDDRFASGTVGLWTEDDSVVEFADLKVSTN